jgi:hypothetical protein
MPQPKASRSVTMTAKGAASEPLRVGDLLIEQTLLREIEDDLAGPVLERGAPRRPSLALSAHLRASEQALDLDRGGQLHRDLARVRHQGTELDAIGDHALPKGCRPSNKLERLRSRETTLIRAEGRAALVQGRCSVSRARALLRHRRRPASARCGSRERCREQRASKRLWLSRHVRRKGKQKNLRKG